VVNKKSFNTGFAPDDDAKIRAFEMLTVFLQPCSFFWPFENKK
jgi:hypothetical protein